MNCRWLLGSVLLALVGCANPINNVVIGMSKPQVFSELGDPDSTAARGNVEILRYHEGKPPAFYFVRLVNGQVESFGQIGDFDSAKDPTLDVNVTHRELDPQTTN